VLPLRHQKQRRHLVSNFNLFMNIILSIIALAASVWIFFGYIDPEYHVVKDLKNEKSSYEQALASASEAETLKTTLAREFNSLDPSELDKLDVLLPHSVDEVRFIIEVDAIAKTHNLSMTDTKVEATNSGLSDSESLPSQSKKPRTFKETRVQFSLTGTYPNFVAFLKGLEKDLRVVDVYSLSVSPVLGTIYRYDLGVKTYWLE